MLLKILLCQISTRIFFVSRKNFGFCTFITQLGKFCNLLSVTGQFYEYLLRLRNRVRNSGRSPQHVCQLKFRKLLVGLASKLMDIFFNLKPGHFYCAKQVSSVQLDNCSWWNALVVSNLYRSMQMFQRCFRTQLLISSFKLMVK